MAYDHLISNSGTIFLVINVEVICNDFVDGKIRHDKRHLNKLCGTLQASGYAVLNLVIY